MRKRKSVKVIPLGGLGEIGKNITAIEYEDEIIVIDCGISFPDEDMYGVDLVIPDVAYLIENKDKVKGLFLTHGHEDHIGAIPYILKQINMPIYGTRLTLGLVKNKLEEHNMTDIVTIYPVESGDIVTLDKIKVEFIKATHSIADACSLAITTPVGVIIHTGDFKIDYTPIDGRLMDLNRFSTLGKKGVLLLLADSTNIERPGHSLSEKTIGETLNRIFTGAKGRVIVATFASNIHRMQQIANASIKENRKIVFSGRSMENVSKVAIELGYLNIPTESLIDIDDMNRYPDENITIITTGSQGEAGAGLSRIAFGSHRKIEIHSDDLFIISASPIPGNDKIISRVINQLFRKGVEVIYEDLEDIHVSGHAYQEELKLIHTLVNPKYFMPVHGEYRHLKQHGELATKLGLDEKSVVIPDVGDIIEVTRNSIKKNGTVASGQIFVDGLGVGDVGNIVLRDRKHLSQDGILTVVVTLSKENKSIVAGPDIISRGFVYVRESEGLMDEARDIVRNTLLDCEEKKITDWATLKSNVRDELRTYLYEKTKRKPMILPIIMEI